MELSSPNNVNFGGQVETGREHKIACRVLGIFYFFTCMVVTHMCSLHDI